MSNRTTIKQTTTGGPLKTFLLQFIYNEGNGWAIINATTVSQAKSVFEVQTQYKGAQVTDIKETKYFGDNIQLVFEGAVTTMYNSGGNIIVSKKEYETFMRLVGAELSKYYTKDEIDDILKNVPIDVDLSNYYTKSEVNYRISTIPKGEQGEQGPPGPTGPRGLQGEPGTPGTPGRNGTDGHDGADGLTPYIGPDNNWWIGETNTRIKAVGEDGKFADLTPEEKESLRGADGVGITNVTGQYARNNNSASAPTSGWSTTFIIPTPVSKYVWMRIVLTLSNNTTKTTPPIIVNIYNEGGGNGSANIDIINQGEQPTDPSTLYFFDSSLLQGVGSYNNLLHGENPNEDIFSPNKLYVLEKNGTYKEVQDNDPEHPIVTIIDNRVYCYNEITPMFNLGEVLLSNTIKYAESSDCALFSFIVKGPFYSDTTRVQLTYDSSKIRVEYKAGNNWINISSGYIFNITNKDYYIPRRLKIIRVDIDFNASDFDGITSYLTTQLSFNNYYEIKTADILYNKTYLIYKDGRFYQRPGEDNFIMGANGSVGWVVDKNDNPIGTTSSITNNTTEGCLVWSHIGAKTNYNYLRITKGFTLDYSKYNVVYAIFKQAGGGSYAANKIYVSDGQGGGNTGGRNASYEFYKYVNIWGLGAIKCPARDVNMGGTRTIKAWLHKGYYEDNVLPKISELGITIYKQPFEI